jgi:pyrroline-5-carboxylate reductase
MPREEMIDAVTALSGSGPAYGFLFIEALADGAVRAGMGRAEATLLAASTLEGAARMVRETGKHPAELKDMVMSPGGTTAAGVAALERGAFRATVMDAVLSAWQRCRELSG